MKKLILEIIKKKLELIKAKINSKLENLKNPKHIHNWEFLSQSKVYEASTNKSDSYPIGERFVYQCKDTSCRKVKTEKTY